MKVREVRTNGDNYHLHVFKSKDGEVLSIPRLANTMKTSGIIGEIEITGWKGIHLVIMTSNNPSLEKIHVLCKKIKRMEKN